MTEKKSTRLAGHGLLREGKAYEKKGRQTHFTGDVKGVGLCECGVTSDVLDSDNARKRWHREHKAAIRAEREKDCRDSGLPHTV